MKLRPRQNSTQPRIFEDSEYTHPWYTHLELYGDNNLELRRPNPPSKEAIERAKFVDKTYKWKRRDNSVRS